MNRSVFTPMTPGLVATCVAAAVLTPTIAPAPAVQPIPVQLTSVAQSFDVLDAALTTAQLPDAEVLEALDIAGAAGFISSPVWSTVAGLFNTVLNLVTMPLSWLGLSSLVTYPVSFVESIISTIVSISPVAAVDVGDLTATLGVPALPDLALPNLDGFAELAQDAGAALLSLLG
jgi:hypothetical protein